MAVFAEHGPVLRALADAAADDPEVDEAYAQLVTELRRRDGGAHRARDRRATDPAADARETAVALVWINERYLTLSLGREPAADRAVVAGTLHTIWSWALYGAR